MKVEQAKQIASKAIQQLSEALERGHSETLRNYLATMARFHRYSLHNLILIVSQVSAMDSLSEKFEICNDHATPTKGPVN